VFDVVVRARAALVFAAAAGLAVAASAGAEDIPIVEAPAAACDVCTPGKPPPPAEVQERVRRINRHANWREPRPEPDTIPLGTQTRIWLQRAWASGRLQPGVARSGSVAAPVAPALRSPAPSARRNSLAERSRTRLADRSSTRDGSQRGSRSRRGEETSRASSARGTPSSGSSLGAGLGSGGSPSGLFGSGSQLGQQ
jgi:hypothetical protein